MDTEEKKKFEEIYLNFQLILKRIAYRHQIPADYVDDVVQETFLSYASHHYSVDKPSEEIKPLLTKILESRCMDFHRNVKQKYHRGAEEEDMEEETVPTISGPSDFIISKERCRAILAEIDGMPENLRSVAVLKLIKGYSTKEICESLAITEKACYTRLSRIRIHLQKLLKKESWL